KQFLATIVNSLALVVTLFVGVQISAQFAQFTGHIFSDLAIAQNIGSIFKTITPYIYVLSAVVTTAIIPSVIRAVWKLNNEAIDTIKALKNHPKETINQLCKG